MNVDLAILPDHLRQYVEGLVADNLHKEHVIRLQKEQIRLLNLKLFGPKTEKLSPAQTQLLFEEPSVLAQEVEKEAARPESQKQNPLPKRKARRRSNPGREPLPAILERRVEIIPCRPEDRHCEHCEDERPVIGYETHEELVCVPAVFYIRVCQREKRGSHCHEEEGVATAPVPPRIVPGGKLSNEFIVESIAQKYQQYNPIYRQCAALAENHGIELSRKTLNDGVLAAGSLLRPVTRSMAKELMAGRYIQSDETPVPCQMHDQSGRNHQAYAWQFSRPGGNVVFEFLMSREREGPKQFLQGFRGKLQTDGYAAYDDLGEGIIFVGCMAHARRGFVDAAKVAPMDPLPGEIVGLFGQLYAVERQARESNAGPERRREMRQAQSVPLMVKLKARLLEIRQTVPPGMKLAKACDYVFGQWPRLEEYLKDGELEIDNNWCEGAMRPVALGRKNWMHVGSPEAGPKIAAILSVVETCRRLDINLRKYLLDVLPKLAAWPITRVGELTPIAWKSAQ